MKIFWCFDNCIAISTSPISKQEDPFHVEEILKQITYRKKPESD